MKHHFRDDILFGGRFITALDNHINDLLDECENVEQPRGVDPKCFSMSHVFHQVERGAFNFSLPSILKQKKHHEEVEVTGNKKNKARIENSRNDTTSNRDVNGCMIVAE